MKKPFKELDLSNAFLFAAALEDEETCQQVLEIILEFPIKKKESTQNIRCCLVLIFAAFGLTSMQVMRCRSCITLRCRTPMRRISRKEAGIIRRKWM